MVQISDQSVSAHKNVGKRRCASSHRHKAPAFLRDDSLGQAAVLEVRALHGPAVKRNLDDLAAGDPRRRELPQSHAPGDQDLRDMEGPQGQAVAADQAVELHQAACLGREHVIKAGPHGVVQLSSAHRGR